MRSLLRFDGRIDRRLLVNLRVEPEAVAPLLPPGLRPALVDGWAVAGMCFIRLAGLRPRPMPAALGLTTENLAHRIAVEWDDGDEPRAGVWIPSRRTSSPLAASVGGRLFPAVHSVARFAVHERADVLAIRVADHDGPVAIAVCDRSVPSPPSQLFRTVDEARRFFSCATIGRSPSRRPGRHDVVDLSVDRWALQPVAIDTVRSNVLDRFVADGRAAWDSAFLMEDVGCAWTGATIDAHAREQVAA